MTDEWELLHVTGVTRVDRQIPDGDATTTVRRCETFQLQRLSLLRDDRLGIATAIGEPSGADLSGLIARAIEDAKGGPRHPGQGLVTRQPGLASPPAPVEPLMQALPWLADVGEDSVDVSYRIWSPDSGPVPGGIHERWRVAGLGEAPCGRVPEGAPRSTDPPPAWDPSVWLFPPWALAQLLLEPVSTALVAGAEHWPRFDVRDPGWGGGVDMEGVPRLPRTLVRDGRPKLVIADRRRAWHAGGTPTGHAGISGPVIRDLLVGDAGSRPLPAAGAVVTDVTRLDGDHRWGPAHLAVQLSSYDLDVRTVAFAAFECLADLIDHGQWCGPWQRGKGSWTSRWLAVEQLPG